MFPAPLLVLLLADTTAASLDSWLPERMAQLRIPAVAVAVITNGSTSWTWSRGVENVLTRRAVSERTVWPGGEAGDLGVTAAPHARVSAILSPGLIVLAVWSALAWVLLIPVSLLFRKRWRFGRWHEVLAVLLGAGITWAHLNQLGGTVLASYLTALPAGMVVVPLLVAALAWPKSKALSLIVLVSASALAWSARDATLPMPAFRAPDHGATVEGLAHLARSALQGDLASRSGAGFVLEGTRWTRADKSRGAEALFVLLPQPGSAVVVVSNAGNTGSLLREIVDSVAR